MGDFSKAKLAEALQQMTAHKKNLFIFLFINNLKQKLITHEAQEPLPKPVAN